MTHTDHTSAAQPCDTTLGPMARGYILHLRLERNLSANTIEAYRNDLAHLEAFLRSHGLSPAGVRLRASSRQIIRSPGQAQNTAPIPAHSGPAPSSLTSSPASRPGAGSTRSPPSPETITRPFMHSAPSPSFTIV